MHPPQRTVPDITAGDLLSRVYLLADDSMGGRELGTEGYRKATAYVASEFRRLKLEPAGDCGSFFQNVPVVRRWVDSTSSFAVDATPLALWHDYAPLRPLPLDASAVPAIYGGRLGDTTTAIAPDSVVGKLVVFTAHREPDGTPDLRVARYLARTRSLDRAAGFAFAWLDRIPGGANSVARRQYGFSTASTPMPPPHAVALYYITSEVGARLFGLPAHASLDSLRVGTTGTAVVVRTVVDSAPALARNVVAILRGRDRALRNEYVAVGAHNDHIGTAPAAVDHDSVRAYNILLRGGGFDGPWRGSPPNPSAPIRVNVDSLRRIHPPRPDSIYNGADDDGAGTAALLEIAESVAHQRARPRRSLLFISHAAEESGLLGSQWYSNHPTVPRDSIVAYLNMDLLGHGDSVDVPGGGPGYVQSGGARRLSTEYAALIDSVNAAEHQPLTIDYSWDAPGHPSQKYCRSDHASYARYGIPVAYFSTGYSIDYHQITDEPQYLDYPHMARVAQFVHDIAVRVADRDHRPAVDQPKPDPAAPCRQ